MSSVNGRPTIRRFVFITRDFHPEETATAEMLSGIAFALSEHGVAVEVVTGPPFDHPGGQKAPRLPSLSTHRGVVIRRVWTTGLDRHGLLRRLLNSLTFTFSALLATFRYGRDSLLVAVTVPPVLIWLCRVVNALRGTPYVVLVYDNYPDIAAACGVLRADSAAFRLWARVNDSVYARAAAIVVPGTSMRDHMAARLHCSWKHKLKVIHNWADHEFLQPTPREGNPLLAEWGWENRFVIQYSGNLGRVHEVRTLLAAAARLDPERFGVVFVGHGWRMPWVRSECARLGLKHVRVEPFQPRAKLPTSLAACDVSVVSLLPETRQLSVPSKIYGIMAVGRPILAVAAEGSEPERLVKAHGMGLVINPGDVDGTVRAIETLAADRALRERMGAAGRAALETAFTRRHAVCAWLALLDSLHVQRSTGGGTEPVDAQVAGH